MGQRQQQQAQLQLRQEAKRLIYNSTLFLLEEKGTNDGDEQSMLKNLKGFKDYINVTILIIGWKGDIQPLY